MGTDCICLLSGGLDSTVLATMLAKAPSAPRVIGLSIDYGQRHGRELRAASAVAERIGIEHRIIDLKSLLPILAGASLTDAAVPVPHGHFEDESMRATVVPNRNMILLAVAAAAAISSGVSRIAYAAHRGDHAIYPDCREKFISAMAHAMRLCHFDPIMLDTPFSAWTKKAIVQAGAAIGAPMGLSWSCYEGGAIHCGKCGTCVERREAFMLAGIHDPTEYAG